MTTHETTKAPKRKRRGESFWRRALTAQDHSGLSQLEFCRRNGLAVSTFHGWRRRLRETPIESEGPQSSFVEVCRPTVSEPDSQQDQMELIFPSGLRLKLPSQVEGRTLAEILWALEATEAC